MRLDPETNARLVKEANKHIARAKRHDIDLDLKHFEVIDNEIYLDGMDPDDWIDAMIMD